MHEQTNDLANQNFAGFDLEFGLRLIKPITTEKPDHTIDAAAIKPDVVNHLRIAA